MILIIVALVVMLFLGLFKFMNHEMDVIEKQVVANNKKLVELLLLGEAIEKYKGKI